MFRSSVDEQSVHSVTRRRRDPRGVGGLGPADCPGWRRSAVGANSSSPAVVATLGAVFGRSESTPTRDAPPTNAAARCGRDTGDAPPTNATARCGRDTGDAPPTNAAARCAHGFLVHNAMNCGILRFRVGEWRSLVARLLWEQDVAGSNPVSPTMKLQVKRTFATHGTPLPQLS